MLKLDKSSPSERWRVQMLFEQCLSPFVSLVLVPPLFVYVMLPVNPHSRLYGWLAAMTGVTAIRVAHAVTYFRLARRQTALSVASWDYGFCLGVFFSSLLWGAANWFFFPAHSMVHQAFMCFVIAGMAAGAIGSYSPSIFSVTTFLFIYLLPFIARLLAERSPMHTIMAAMVLLFLLLCTGTARRLNFYLLENFKMREKQTGLLSRMQYINRDLAVSIASLHRSQVETLHASRLAAVGEMSAGIAHEINNPLAIIEGAATRLYDLSQKQALTPEVLGEGLDRIRTTVARISHIIRGLLTFSAHTHTQPPAATSLEKILQQTLDLCRERFLINRIDLEVAPFPTHLVVECIPVQISQVLLNLLSNAFDAVENLDIRWVKVTIRDLDGKVEIAITDSGQIKTGVQPEEWFRPFYTTKEVGRGTGLGLSVSKGIVEMHLGKILVDTKSGNTRVVVTLPKVSQRKAA